MIKIRELLAVNLTSVGISLTEVEQYLQIGILIFSGIISIIASIQRFKNGEKN